MEKFEEFSINKIIEIEYLITLVINLEILGCVMLEVLVELKFQIEVLELLDILIILKMMFMYQKLRKKINNGLEFMNLTEEIIRSFKSI